MCHVPAGGAVSIMCHVPRRDRAAPCVHAGVQLQTRTPAQDRLRRGLRWLPMRAALGSKLNWPVRAWAASSSNVHPARASAFSTAARRSAVVATMTASSGSIAAVISYTILLILCPSLAHAAIPANSYMTARHIDWPHTILKREEIVHEFCPTEAKSRRGRNSVPPAPQDTASSPGRSAVNKRAAGDG